MQSKDETNTDILEEVKKKREREREREGEKEKSQQVIFRLLKSVIQKLQLAGQVETLLKKNVIQGIPQGNNTYSKVFS